MVRTLSPAEQFTLAEQGEAVPAARGLFGFDVSYRDCAVVVLAVPWELTVSYGRGTAAAPQAILRASHEIDLYAFGFAQRAYRRGMCMQELAHPVIAEQQALLAELATLPAAQHAARINDLSLALNTAVQQASAQLLADGKRVVLLGGDHSVPFGFLQQLGTCSADWGILHLDAHFDYRRAYQGLHFSHASIMWQTMTQIKAVRKIVHVGIRDFCAAEYDFMRSLQARAAVFFDYELYRRGFAAVVDDIIARLPAQVYISFDIDALDPSLCPHTGTPVPGGLSYNDVLLLFEKLHASGKQVIGADLCEVVPAPNRWDENVAARILYQLCALMASR